jgi:hypothetical protein
MNNDLQQSTLNFPRNNCYETFVSVYDSYGITHDMLHNLDDYDLKRSLNFLRNKSTPEWVIDLMMRSLFEYNYSEEITTPKEVVQSCSDIEAVLASDAIERCFSDYSNDTSLEYGEFSEKSEDMYGEFTPHHILYNSSQKPQGAICCCGYDICDVHPSNRHSGLYDPEDYIDDIYQPNFYEVSSDNMGILSDFEEEITLTFDNVDYTRKDYICRFDYETNIFGDKVVKQKNKYRVQVGWEEIKNYYINMTRSDGPGFGLKDAAMCLNTKFATMDREYLLKLIDDIVMFVKLSTEKVEGMVRFDIVVRAVTIFLKCRYNESSYKIYMTRVFPFIKKIWSGFTPQSGDFFESSRSFLNSYKNICESEIAKKIYRCCMYLLSLSVFDTIGITMDSLGYSKLEQAALKKKFFKKSDFLYVLADTLLFILERGYQVFKTGDIYTIFHSGGTYKEIYEKCRELQRREPLLNNPEEHGFTESGFRSDLDNVIEKLESVFKHSVGLDKNDVTIIRSTLNDMLIMRDDLNTHSAARRDRKAPFSLLVYGDSGIGKTSITNILCTYFAKHEKLPLGDEFRYTKNPAAKFWDGYTSSCHTIVLDDVANESPDLKDSKSLDEVIQVINNAAFCPDQAALDKKGRTPMRAKLVVATTNVKDLNTYHLFSRPSAVQRRFPYIITPSVREEYKDERGMLSSENVTDLSPYPELWTFKVERVQPVAVDQGKRLATIHIVEENMSLRDLLSWLHIMIDKFNLDQNRVRKCIDAMKEVDLCMVCSLPDTLCTCNVQGGYSDFGSEMCSFTIFCGALIIIKYWRDIENMFKTLKTINNTVTKTTEVLNNVRVNANIAQYFVENTLANAVDAQYWQGLGDRVSQLIGHPKIFLTMVGTLGCTYSLYKMYKQCSPQSGEVGSRPVAELNSKENVWYNNDIDLCTANFSRESSSSKGMEFSEFCKKISDNVIHTSIIREDGKRALGKMLCLGGHIYVTNNHNIPTLNCTYMNIIKSSKKGVGANMKVVLSDGDLMRFPEKDLAFVTIREMPPMKKIVQYFKLGDANGVFNGKYVTRCADGSVCYRDVKNIQRLPQRKLKFPSYNINACNSLWKGKVSDYTSDGDCGSPLVINSDYGYSILGLHFLANNLNGSEVFAADIDGDFVNSTYMTLTSHNISEGDMRFINSKTTCRKVGDLHKKSVFRYIDEGNMSLYGSFTDFRGKSGSKVCETPMSKKLESLGYVAKFCKPEMKSWVPWHIAAQDIVKPIHELDTVLLEECKTNYLKNVCNKVELNDIKDQMIVLDDFTAINGACVSYVDKMNRNTSAGNPWKKSKKFFLTSVLPKHGMLDPVEVDSEIMDRVYEMINIYKTGKRVNPNFCAHLKDEPVSFKKAKIGKTRVFTGAPFDWCIVVRKYLLSFTRLLQNNRFAFEAGPGTVAQSLEWQEMYDYIVKHGLDRIVAGDYKAFDKKMSPKEIIGAFEIIISICKLSGNYTEEDITVIRGIAEDTAFAIVDFNGDLVQLFGSNPSGNPLTVILNGIVNSLRMRYVYRLINPEKTVEDFSDKVSLMTYGDDNIMSVHKSAEWFNHTNIAKTFAELDIIYTMADKEAKSIPFIHIKDASFLKRTWRLDDNLGCMMAPLDHDSIEKMLTVWNRSKAVTEEYQGMAVISTALREYFFYGETTFSEKRKMLQNLVKELNWEDWIEESTFPSYTSLCEQFKRSSKYCRTYDRYF